MEGTALHQGVQGGKELPPMWKIPIESGARRDVVGEIPGRKDVNATNTQKAEETNREKVVMQMQEKDFTAVDIALRKLLIENSGAQILSEPEAKNLIKKMQEEIGKFAFHDGVFLDEMQAAGRPLFDTKRSIKISADNGKEAVFKIMLKTDTGEFKLQGDVLDPKGQYAEELLN